MVGAGYMSFLGGFISRRGDGWEWGLEVKEKEKFVWEIFLLDI